MIARLTLLFLLLALVGGLPASQRPTTAIPRGRSVTFAPHGMVACAQPLAAQIGLDVLKQGGSAVDAAIATNAALGLMEPTSCGLGGDLYALVWDAKTQKLYALNASGRSAYKATIAAYRARGLKQVPMYGALSWSVPGCVDGWAELHKKFGRVPLAKLLGPTIHYAEEGFPVSPVIAGYWRASERRLQRDPGSAATLLINGRAPRPGQVFRNPMLARCYREIAEGGRDAFYKGRIAKELVALCQQHDGLFTMKDFADHTSTWVEPVSTNYRGYDVWEIPPPCQGIATLEMLNLLEGFDLKKYGPNSADWWHLFVEAKKIAYADRGRYYADPQFAKVPVAELISKHYADQRRSLIDLAKARTDLKPGDPRAGASDTTYLCVVDKDRNCVSLIQSNFAGFGSGLASAELGFGVQNRGTLFALDENHPNKLGPHKRPFHTIIPSMVTKDGKPWLVFGVMGGDMQPQGHVEILVNLIDFDMNVQQAGEAPRLEHVGSATPKGQPGDPRGGTIQAEPGIPEDVVRELEKRGHRVRRVRVNGGGFQGIMIDPRTNVLLGGSEPRKDGMAIGY